MDRKLLSWVEISRSSLLHQVRQFKKLAGRALLFPVVKSNAYGHGIEPVISVLHREQAVSGFMVFNLDEALQILPKTKKQIFILSAWQDNAQLVTYAVRHGIVFPIFDIKQAHRLNAIGKKIRRTVKVQIKIDVGTMRLGFRYTSLHEIHTIFQLPHLNVVGIFSHFADSENRDNSFTNEQLTRFENVIKRLEKRGVSCALRHIACSAAVLCGRKYCCNAVRIGLATYGVWPSSDMQRLYSGKIVMKPALSWKTRIIQIKDLKKGETVGYGLSYKAQANTRIAVIPVGYWDGYDRKLSNCAEVLISGHRCRVRGRVCMNLTMIELPKKVATRVGDEVVLIGKQKKHCISAEELARHVGTINYEVVTRINPLIPRILTH